MGTDIHFEGLTTQVRGRKTRIDPVVLGLAYGNDWGYVKKSMPLSKSERPRNYFAFGILADIRGDGHGVLEYEYTSGTDYDCYGHTCVRLPVSEMATQDEKWNRILDNEGATAKYYMGWYYELFQELEQFCEKEGLDPTQTYFEYWFDS